MVGTVRLVCDTVLDSGDRSRGEADRARDSEAVFRRVCDSVGAGGSAIGSGLENAFSCAFNQSGVAHADIADAS